ncbi:hypothetical protein [Azonexus hydrophilus]|uniref:Uncharacterized protein n=1 Tax=Azonexus hydrophilus TaxID=418702 RepID=A0ABZ2XLW7_9RHOO
MSFTVWAYDHDAAEHHCNDLTADTFSNAAEAAKCARQRVVETNHNTGYAKVVDNAVVGRLGDTGVLAVFKKDRNGRVFGPSVCGG